jgi:hypothetical protein
MIALGATYLASSGELIARANRVGASSISCEDADHLHVTAYGKGDEPQCHDSAHQPMTVDSIGGRFKSLRDREMPPAIAERAFRVLGDAGLIAPPLVWLQLW